jgi:WD domain, G-beta repeat
VTIWESATGKALLSLEGHDNFIASVVFSPDGRRVATGSEDKTVKIWDSASGKVLLALKGHGGQVESVAFSPDGRFVASGSDDNSVRIWDSTIGKELSCLKGHGAAVRSVAFSPDGRRLSSGGDDRTVRIWDAATGRELMCLKGHGATVTSVTFSPDSQRLATASADRTIKIWDGTNGKELLSLKGQDFGFVGVAFSPDGTRLAASDTSATVHLWETTSISPKDEQNRQTTQMVGNLFRELILRADVVERLRMLPGLSPLRKQEAMILAEQDSEEPAWALNDLAWPLVKQAGGDIAAYRKAVRFSEVACQSEPSNGRFLNTLGIGYYRVGNYEKALTTLRRSIQMNKTLIEGGPLPVDLAFLAMTEQRLGHAKEARAQLEHLRERMRQPLSWTDEPKGFLREAEALLATPKTPGGK